jgi:hypothetical protein
MLVEVSPEPGEVTMNAAMSEQLWVGKTDLNS